MNEGGREREILSPIDIAHADGRLRREAVGWARHAVHRCNLERGWPRVAAWNYWCISSRAGALTVLVADVGHFGLALVSFLDHARSAPVDRLHVRPFGLGFEMPPTPRHDIVLDARRLHLTMRVSGDELHVQGDARTLLGSRLIIDLCVSWPGSHETINVLVPFDETSFQFTSKHQALPVRGVVRVDSKEHRFGPENESFACLDFGRGRWPPRIAWNWAFGAATRGGRTIGMNLGGQWTDGTGVTENGFVVDGRVHKIPDAVVFAHDRRAPMEPWHIRTRESGQVDLRFVPRSHRKLRIPLGPIRLHLDQHMGEFDGTLADEAGSRIALERVIGLAESFSGRWSWR